jgi:hypothetical protein
MTETWRPKVGAILTVLGWNLLPLIGLAAWIWAVLAAPKTGEDWSGVVAVILMIFGGGATVLAAAAGVVIAAIVTGRKQRSGAVLSTGASFGWGTASAVLGWLVPILAFVVYLLYMQIPA